MFKLTNVFKFIIHGFYYRTLTEQYFIAHSHQAILHVVSNTGNQVNVIGKEYVDEFIGNVALISKKFTEHSL